MATREFQPTAVKLSIIAFVIWLAGKGPSMASLSISMTSTALNACRCLEGIRRNAWMTTNTIPSRIPQHMEVLRRHFCLDSHIFPSVLLGIN
jgi:hypothetical protein